MRKSVKKISFAGPWITKKEFAYVSDALKNGWYQTFDKHIKKLEQKVCHYLPVKYSIATHCCTNALHLATASLDLKKGDEVICTDFSWVATAYAITYTGATAVFVDIEPDTWCIDPKAIKKAITKKTKAIMLVHTFGQPAEMDEIMKLAKNYNLKVIEDAAPSLGSKYKGRKTGTFGDIACFSFQGGKIAVSGEGGIFVTNNRDIYQKALLLASMGRTDSPAVFWSDMLGFQYTIGNLPAALALAQVERIDELISKKRQIFNWYYERLKDERGIKIIKEKPYCKSNYAYPSIFLEDNFGVNRDKILKIFKDYNVHARPAFPRMSLFPVFKARFSNPVCEKVSKRGISLPAAFNLNENDVDYVCELFKKIVRQKIA